MAQRFGEEEAGTILREALQLEEHRPEGSVDLDDLVRTGAELGIPEARIREVAERVRAGRRDAALEAEYRATARRGLLFHAVPYFGVNLMMLGMLLFGRGSAVALLGTGFGWGIGFVSHAISVFDERGESYRNGLREFLAERAARAPDEPG